MMTTLPLPDQGMLRVNPGKRRQEYLEKAKKAEARADQTQDVSAKAIWRQVAEMYREMARLEPNRV